MKTNIFNKVKAAAKGLLPLYLFTLLPLLVSCDDFLETPSKSSIPADEAYSSAASIDMNLTGLYGALKPYATYYFVMSEFRSDNMFETTEAKTNQYADCAQFNSVGLLNDNIVASCWADHYTLIAAANTLIDKMGEAKDLTPEMAVQYEAEARFLRALSYFDLVRFFGRVPASLHELTREEAFQLPQSEAIDIYNKIIIPDLTYAVEHLTTRAVDYSNAQHTERATQIAAKALLGKVYLQMAGYPLYQDTKNQAEELFGEVLNEFDWANKWAEDIDEWNRMWIHENDNRHFIFEIQYINEKNQGNPAAWLSRGSNTKADYYFIS